MGPLKSPGNSSVKGAKVSFLEGTLWDELNPFV